MGKENIDGIVCESRREASFVPYQRCAESAHKQGTQITISGLAGVFFGQTYVLPARFSNLLRGMVVRRLSHAMPQK
nr:MAG TPA: hypothetical protein [Caudoviricetes sp.]